MTPGSLVGRVAGPTCPRACWFWPRGPGALEGSAGYGGGELDPLWLPAAALRWRAYAASARARRVNAAAPCAV
jgi:hypothetical protein